MEANPNWAMGQLDWTDIIFSSCDSFDMCSAFTWYEIYSFACRSDGLFAAQFRLHIKAHIFHEGRIKSKWNEWHRRGEITTVCHEWPRPCGRTPTRQHIIYSTSWCAPTISYTFTQIALFFISSRFCFWLPLPPGLSRSFFDCRKRDQGDNFGKQQIRIWEDKVQMPDAGDCHVSPN